MTDTCPVPIIVLWMGVVIFFSGVVVGMFIATAYAYALSISRKYG